MLKRTQSRFPAAELHLLDFLVGECSGPATVFPPGQDPIQFIGNFNATRESCDRYLRIEFYADVPILGRESAHVLMTYADECSCYKMWIFSSMREEPTVLYGEFRDDVLTFVGEPSKTIWGMQRMRCSLRRVADGVVDYCSEFWTIDGFVPYFRAQYSLLPPNRTGRE